MNLENLTTERRNENTMGLDKRWVSNEVYKNESRRTKKLQLQWVKN